MLVVFPGIASSFAIDHAHVCLVEAATDTERHTRIHFVAGYRDYVETTMPFEEVVATLNREEERVLALRGGSADA